MLKKISLFLSVITFMMSCSSVSTEKKSNTNNDSLKLALEAKKLAMDSLQLQKKDIPTNDTLNAMANVISGISDTSHIYQFIQSSSQFNSFSTSFDKRWKTFDSTRLQDLRTFSNNEISKAVKNQNTLFYPFSGPDILYAQTFFPKVDTYVMIGLEPVGSLPEFNKMEMESLDLYFDKVNTSLNAILKFSFFRTESMSKDLKNEEVDGTLHLLLLFLKRTGNQFCSVKPVTVDSMGALQFVDSFEQLKKLKAKTKGVEIQFVNVNKELKKLYYFSLNAANSGLKNNAGFVTYLNGLGTINTYLKGASYLMHKDYFSIIRNVILKQSSHVVQDDSGIACHYFMDDTHVWDYACFGLYSKPISLFSNFYQRDLDSIYKTQGTKPIGFGIGYNFKDKNSNMMIATKVK